MFIVTASELSLVLQLKSKQAQTSFYPAPRIRNNYGHHSRLRPRGSAHVLCNGLLQQGMGLERHAARPQTSGTRNIKPCCRRILTPFNPDAR